MKLISIRETCQRTSLSRTTLWQRVKAGDFPRPVKIGNGIRKAFVESEVEDLIAARIAERDVEAA